MSLYDRLRRLADALPENVSVTFSQADLLELLSSESAPGGNDPGGADATVPATADLTVSDVAVVFGRADSTIRTWIGEDQFPNAYKFRGREWRIPRGDITAIQQAEAERFRKPASTVRARDPVDLGAWRRAAGLSSVAPKV